VAFSRLGTASLLATGVEPSKHFADHFSLINSCLLEVLILATGGYLLYQRTRNTDRCSRREHLVGLVADLLGTTSIALWFLFQFPS
jgi:hypothetical protein